MLTNSDVSLLQDLIKEARHAYTATSVRPRTHGNGYIQLTAPPYQVHFWGHPKVPRQNVSTQIHDHTYGFDSQIVKGRVFHIPYRCIPSVAGSHQFWKPTLGSREDTLEPTGEFVWCEPDEIQQLQQGDSYSMRPFDFHEVFTPAGELAITIVRRTEQPNGLPRIVVPAGMEPDVCYNRYAVDAETLWGWIAEFL